MVVVLSITGQSSVSREFDPNREAMAVASPGESSKEAEVLLQSLFVAFVLGRRSVKTWRLRRKGSLGR